MICINTKMPTGCDYCFAKEDDFTGRHMPSICKITNKVLPCDTKHRPKNCPLKEMKEERKTKMIEKTIVYAVPTYYKQTVKVPEGLDDTDIIDLWEKDELETGEVEDFDNIFSESITDVFVLED